MAISGSGALSGAASGAATGAAFGPWGAGIGALAGGIGGAFLGGEGDDRYTEAANAAAAQSILGKQGYQDLMQPYMNQGLGYLPMLDYMNLGTMPTWGDEQQSELDRLMGSEKDLLAQKQELEGKLQVAGTSHDTRHYADVFAPQLSKVQAQLDQLNQLRTQRQSYQALQNPETAAALGNDGRQYIDQLKNLDVTPSLEQLENDPIYQWQQKQLMDTINRQQASIGGLNSRDTYNISTDASMGLASQEADKLYGRQYNSILDQFGITNNLYNQRYGRMADGVNRGLGATTNYGQVATNQLNNVGSAYQNMNLNQTAYNQSQPSMFQNLLGSAQQGIGNYQDYKFDTEILNPFLKSKMGQNNQIQVQPITMNSGGLGKYGTYS